MQDYRRAQSKLRAFISILIMFFIVNESVIFASCSMVKAPSKEPEETKIVIEKEKRHIISLGMQEGEIFLVKEKIDLKNAQVNIPANVTIVFKNGGAIVNGTLNGFGTKIETQGNDILGVKLVGTWCVDKVKDAIFSREFLSDTEILGNLNAIQSDTVFNEITVTRDYAVTVPKSGGSGLILKSNTDLQIKGTLTLVPNDYKSYSIISIKGKHNVSINGGRLVGDVEKHSYIEGTTSEWGMGVNIQESQNVSLNGLYITRCIGDGIYITGGKETSIGVYEHASKNVTIQDVTCDANRRQGLSIIHVDGLVVSNCSFVNTGQIEFTEPGAGIDIEPNVKNGNNMSVRNVNVDNCTVYNNVGVAISSSCSFEKNGVTNHENILFVNCYTDGRLVASSNNLLFRGCTFKDVKFSAVYAQTHVALEDCTISGGNGVIIYAPSGHTAKTKDCLLSVDFKDCFLSVAEGKAVISSLISCYKSYIDNLKYVKIENCRLEIPNSKNHYFKLTDYNFKEKMYIYSSLINMEGRDFDASGIVFDNNVIRCRRVVKSPVQNSNRFFTNM